VNKEALAHWGVYTKKKISLTIDRVATNNISLFLKKTAIFGAPAMNSCKTLSISHAFSCLFKGPYVTEERIFLKISTEQLY
jgi:hypothetical protein